jgi:hypothetical protein
VDGQQQLDRLTGLFQEVETGSSICTSAPYHRTTSTEEERKLTGYQTYDAHLARLDELRRRADVARAARLGSDGPSSASRGALTLNVLGRVRARRQPVQADRLIAGDGC